jgi:hypothetical protein
MKMNAFSAEYDRSRNANLVRRQATTARVAAMGALLCSLTVFCVGGCSANTGEPEEDSERLSNAVTVGVITHGKFPQLACGFDSDLGYRVQHAAAFATSSYQWNESEQAWYRVMTYNACGFTDGRTVNIGVYDASGCAGGVPRYGCGKMPVWHGGFPENTPHYDPSTGLDGSFTGTFLWKCGWGPGRMDWETPPHPYDPQEGINQPAEAVIFPSPC